MLTEYPFWRKLVEKCFAELKKQNNNVYFLNWDDAELNGDIIERLQEIKNKSKHTQIQIILYKAEPFCFVPGTNTPLQFHNLLFALKQVVLTNVELVFCRPKIGSADTLFNQQMIQQVMGNNAYGWSWKNIEIKHFPHEIKQIPTIKQMIKYKFSYLSHNHKTVRQLFSKFIQTNNIHTENVVAIHVGRGDDPIPAPYLIDDSEKSLLFSHPLYFHDEWLYNKNLTELFNAVELSEYVHRSVVSRNEINSSNKHFIQQAGIQIIHETMFHYPICFTSEKLLDGLLLGRPFVLIGPPNTLKHLREAGFKTFAPEINESYDEMHDPNTRLEAIMQLVTDLNSKTLEEIQDMVNKLQGKCLHNQKMLAKMKKDLENNLKDAIIKI